MVRKHLEGFIIYMKIYIIKCQFLLVPMKIINYLSTYKIKDQTSRSRSIHDIGIKHLLELGSLSIGPDPILDTLGSNVRVQV